MKIRLAAHLTCAAVCLGLLFADQGRLSSVLYFLYLGVEVFISAITGKQRNDGERRRRQPWWTSTLLPSAPCSPPESRISTRTGKYFSETACKVIANRYH